MTKNTSQVNKFEQKLVKLFKLKFEANIIEEYFLQEKLYFKNTDFKVTLKTAQDLSNCLNIVDEFFNNWRIKNDNWKLRIDSFITLSQIFSSVVQRFKIIYMTQEFSFDTREAVKRALVSLLDKFYKLLQTQLDSYYRTKLKQLENYKSTNDDSNRFVLDAQRKLNQEETLEKFTTNFQHLRKQLIKEGHENYHSILSLDKRKPNYFLVDLETVSPKEIHKALANYFDRKNGKYYRGEDLNLGKASLPFSAIKSMLIDITEELNTKTTTKALALFYSRPTKKSEGQVRPCDRNKIVSSMQ